MLGKIQFEWQDVTVQAEQSDDEDSYGQWTVLGKPPDAERIQWLLNHFFTPGANHPAPGAESWPYAGYKPLGGAVGDAAAYFGGRVLEIRAARPSAADMVH